MKFFVVALCIFAVAAAAPSTSDDLEALRRQPALAHEETHDEDGQFILRYVTAEGTTVMERGRLVPTPDGKGRVMVVEGEVTYIGDDGKKYVTKYSAGLDGSHVEGDHLPVSVTAEPIVHPMGVAPEPAKAIAAAPFKIIAVPAKSAVKSS